MAKKKKTAEPAPITAAEPIEMAITEVIESNYMPYAMTCIVGRAIPDIDGFKPAHRKLLYTMYKMGLLTADTTKSAKVVGQTMMLNPHGDASIYETLAAMTTGKEAQLLPFIKSKGSFGKHYSTMACAASRYTECKLAPIAAEIFDGIDCDAVDFEPNFDNSMNEPALLPTTFPNILAYANVGIAVGMNCYVCSFNLKELCEATIAFLQNENLSVDELIEKLPAPDFSTGASLLYDKDQIRNIYSTGIGPLRLRAKYSLEETNRIIFTEIPYEQKVENIRLAIIAAAKAGKIQDIADVRDETDISGLKLVVDLKRGANRDKVLAQLFKRTALEATFSCNFNILVGGLPRVMGVLEILDEWCAFRVESLRRTYIFNYARKSEKLHLLYGLKEILLDIDEAIRIIRGTKNDSEVIPNLMSGFGIDKLQAEYVADIKLRHLNREFILKRIDEIEQLEKELRELDALIKSDKKIKAVICEQLHRISEKYGIPRKTEILSEHVIADVDAEPETPDYPVTCFLSKEGYFKKCTPASLRGSDDHKLKDGDEIAFTADASNAGEVLFFTSKSQVYKAKIALFDDGKASSLGDYVPVKLGFDEGERVTTAICLKEYTGNIVLFFANGKAVSFPTSAYETKQNRKKLLKAFYGDSPLVSAFLINAPCEFLLRTDAARALLIKSGQVVVKTTRTSSGSQVFTLKKAQKVVSAVVYNPAVSPLSKESKYRKSSLPSAGAIVTDSDDDAQQTLL